MIRWLLIASLLFVNVLFGIGKCIQWNWTYQQYLQEWRSQHAG